MIFKRILFALSVLLCVSASAQNFAWVKPTASNYRNTITRDNGQNILVMGSFSGTYDFDSGDSVYNLTASPTYNAYLQKLDPDGNLIWAKNFTGNYSLVPYAIVTDETDAIYHTGDLEGTADFNPGTGVANIQGHCYISKLNPDGSFAWAIRISTNQTYGYDLIYAENSIYICGSFYGTADFNPSSAVFSMTSAANGAQASGFVARFSLQGEFISAFRLDGNLGSGLVSIASKSNGNLVLCGLTRSPDVPDGAGGFLPISGSDDIFFGEYTPQGTTVWAKSIGSPQYDLPSGMCLDTDENIIVQGSAGANFDADPGSGQAIVEKSFLAKYSPVGVYQWAHGFDATRNYGVTTDGAGNVYASAFTNHDADIDPGDGVFIVDGLPNSRIYIQKLDANGNFVWGYAGPFRASPNIIDHRHEISVSSNGELVTANKFENTFDFDPGASESTLDADTSGGGYLLKFIPDSMGIPQNDFTSTLSWQSQNGILSFRSETETNVEIYNAVGQKMTSFELSSSNDFRFSTDRLPTGIYFIRSSENSRLFRLKILVK